MSWRNSSSTSNGTLSVSIWYSTHPHDQKSTVIPNPTSDTRIASASHVPNELRERKKNQPKNYIYFSMNLYQAPCIRWFRCIRLLILFQSIVQTSRSPPAPYDRDYRLERSRASDLDRWFFCYANTRWRAKLPRHKAEPYCTPVRIHAYTCASHRVDGILWIRERTNSRNE